MSTSDDKFMIQRIIVNLESNIADLEIEIDEEGSGESSTLQAVEQILQDAARKLKEMLKRLN